VAAHDRAQVDRRQLPARSGRASQHDATTASTRAGGGAGKTPGTGRGELPADNGHRKKVNPGPSGVASRGFDPATSRRHAEIRGKDGQYVISDLGSTNGTKVNEAPIGERALEEGDRITIGRTVLEFRRR